MANPLRNPRAPLGPQELQIEKASWIILLACIALPLAARYLVFGVLELPDFSTFFETVGMSPMNASGLASIFVLYLLARPSKDHLETTCVLAFLFEVAYFLTLPGQYDMATRLLLLGGGFGMAGFLSLGHLAIFSSEPLCRRRARTYCRMGAILLAYPYVSGALLSVLSRLNPQVYDAYAYNLEGSLGFFPSLEVARFQALHPWVTHFAQSIYSRLPLWILLAFALGIAYPKRCYSNVFPAFIASGVVVFGFYHCLPMMGIDYFVGLPPWPMGPLPPTAEPVLMTVPANRPRTCIPSMHSCWILIPYFAVKRVSPRWNALYLVLTVGTLMAALGPRVGHYFLDIIPAFPFALAWQAATAYPRPSAQRWRAAGFTMGMLLTLFYLLSIRWASGFWYSHAVAWWLMSLAIVVFSVWMESRLARACLREDDTILPAEGPAAR